MLIKNSRFFVSVPPECFRRPPVVLRSHGETCTEISTIHSIPAGKSFSRICPPSWKIFKSLFSIVTICFLLFWKITWDFLCFTQLIDTVNLVKYRLRKGLSFHLALLWPGITFWIIPLGRFMTAAPKMFKLICHLSGSAELGPWRKCLALFAIWHRCAQGLLFG